MTYSRTTVKWPAFGVRYTGFHLLRQPRWAFVPIFLILKVVGVKLIVARRLLHIHIVQ